MASVGRRIPGAGRVLGTGRRRHAGHTRRGGGCDRRPGHQPGPCARVRGRQRRAAAAPSTASAHPGQRPPELPPPRGRAAGIACRLRTQPDGASGAGTAGPRIASACALSGAHPDPDTDTDTEPEPDTDSDTDTEPEPDADTEPDTDTDPEPDTDRRPVADGHRQPVPVRGEPVISVWVLAETGALAAAPPAGLVALVMLMRSRARPHGRTRARSRRARSHQQHIGQPELVLAAPVAAPSLAAESHADGVRAAGPARRPPGGCAQAMTHSPLKACSRAPSRLSRCSTTRTRPGRPTGGSGRSAARSRRRAPTGTPLLSWPSAPASPGGTARGASAGCTGRACGYATAARSPRRPTSPPSRSHTCARQPTAAGSGR